ncbi:hypothetical protein DTO207G8_6097 [Paecilomyces variotii]|nr:hypothetical protein DTO207G8_6097 [Paecilomyces variotii]
MIEAALGTASTSGQADRATLLVERPDVLPGAEQRRTRRSARGGPGHRRQNGYSWIERTQIAVVAVGKKRLDGGEGEREREERRREERRGEEGEGGGASTGEEKRKASGRAEGEEGGDGLWLGWVGRGWRGGRKG